MTLISFYWGKNILFKNLVNFTTEDIKETPIFNYLYRTYTKSINEY